MRIIDFGKHVKQIRKDNNITQEQMANMLNITRQAISNWENNKNLPDLEMIILMSKLFSLSLERLILDGSDVNNMTSKLLDAGAEAKKSQLKSKAE